MAVRMTKTTKGAADDRGIATRKYEVGEIIPDTQPWMANLCAAFLEIGVAEEVELNAHDTARAEKGVLQGGIKIDPTDFGEGATNLASLLKLSKNKFVTALAPLNDEQVEILHSLEITDKRRTPYLKAMQAKVPDLDPEVQKAKEAEKEKEAAEARKKAELENAGQDGASSTDQGDTDAAKQ